MLDIFLTKKEKQLDEEIAILEEYYQLLKNQKAYEKILLKQREINKELRSQLNQMKDPMNRPQN